MARILPSLGRVFAATYKGPDHLGKPTRSSKIISDASPQYKLALAGLAASGTTGLMKKIGAEVAVRALQAAKDREMPNFGQLAAGSKEHTVTAGDTLGRIAARNKTSVNELARLNQIADPNMIKVGQKLRLPGNEALTPEYIRAAKDLNNEKYGGRPPMAARAAFLEQAARVLNNPNIDEDTRQQVTAAANQVRTGRPGGYLELAKDMIMGPSAAERRELGALSREEIAGRFSAANSLERRQAAWEALRKARDLNPSDFAQETTLSGLLSGEQARKESKHFEDMFPDLPKPPRPVRGAQPQKFSVHKPERLVKRLDAMRRRTRHAYGIATGQANSMLVIPKKHFDFMNIEPTEEEKKTGYIKIAIPQWLVDGKYEHDGSFLNAKQFELLSQQENFQPKGEFLRVLREGYNLKKDLQKPGVLEALDNRVRNINDLQNINIAESFGGATGPQLAVIEENRKRVFNGLNVLDRSELSWFDKSGVHTPGSKKYSGGSQGDTGSKTKRGSKGKKPGSKPQKKTEETPSVDQNDVDLGDDL